MKNIRFGVTQSKVFFVLFVFVFGIGSVSVFAEESPVASVLSIRGNVEYLAGGPVASEGKEGDVKAVSLGSWGKASVSQPVFLNDKFRTVGKARVKILFVDKSMIALGPNSEFEVKKYVFDGSSKLRQGVVSVAHGMAMYIINKSQTNKDSSFKIVTPTANIAARGTQGYVRVTEEATYVGNEAGAVDTENVVTACANGHLPDGVCK